MVVVIRDWSLVIRNFTASFVFTKSIIRIWKNFLIFLLITNNQSLITAMARDFGSHGVIAPIEEEDPLVLIQNKLKRMEEQGELELHNLELQKKTKAAIEQPKPVRGLTKLAPESYRGITKSRIFYYDPTYVVKEDLKDYRGRILHPKGTKINPLETVSLSQGLLFFDGDDEEQVFFAKKNLKENSVKLILVKGAPLALSEKWSVPIYFDQGGLLTKKLGISQVPAFVQQEGMRLRIEETCPRTQGPGIKREDL